MIHGSNHTYIDRGKGQNSVKMTGYDYLVLT